MKKNSTPVPSVVVPSVIYSVIFLTLSLTASFPSFATENIVDKNLDLSLPDSRSKSGNHDENDCISSSKYKRKVLANEANLKILSVVDQYYVESVINKIERITNDTLIPSEIRGSKGHLFSARAEVIIFRTGELCGLRILKSSGSAVFDGMIVNAVKRISPFARFPEQMAKETDAIHLVRTWTFQGSYQKGSAPHYFLRW